MPTLYVVAGPNGCGKSTLTRTAWLREFDITDPTIAPVVTRLDTYGIELNETCGAYSRAVLSLPAFMEWREAALKEPWVVPEDEID